MINQARGGIDVFVGPTMYGLAGDGFTAAGARVHPPVRRGDVARFVKARTPGNIAIVDGTFYGYPSVGHRELREAIQAGWQVWGLSSMGAIRAYELRFLNMRGFGSVYRRFLEQDDFTDDEVALMHQASPPFRPLSEPLVNIRHFLGVATGEGRLCAQASERIASSLAAMWFGDRTLAALQALLVGPWRGELADLQDAMRRFDPYRVKLLDLEAFLSERPWLHEPLNAINMPGQR